MGLTTQCNPYLHFGSILVWLLSKANLLISPCDHFFSGCSIGDLLQRVGVGAAHAIYHIYVQAGEFVCHSFKPMHSSMHRACSVVFQQQNGELTNSGQAACWKK